MSFFKYLIKNECFINRYPSPDYNFLPIFEGLDVPSIAKRVAIGLGVKMPETLSIPAIHTSGESLGLVTAEDSFVVSAWKPGKKFMKAFEEAYREEVSRWFSSRAFRVTETELLLPSEERPSCESLSHALLNLKILGYLNTVNHVSRVLREVKVRDERVIVELGDKHNSTFSEFTSFYTGSKVSNITYGSSLTIENFLTLPDLGLPKEKMFPYIVSLISTFNSFPPDHFINVSETSLEYETNVRGDRVKSGSVAYFCPDRNFLIQKKTQEINGRKDVEFLGFQGKYKLFHLSNNFIGDLSEEGRFLLKTSLKRRKVSTMGMVI